MRLKDLLLPQVNPNIKRKAKQDKEEKAMISDIYDAAGIDLSATEKAVIDKILKESSTKAINDKKMI